MNVNAKLVQDYQKIDSNVLTAIWQLSAVNNAVTNIIAKFVTLKITL